MSWAGLLAELEKSRQQLDRRMKTLPAEAQDKRIGIFCEKGCRNCCHLSVSCSFPEAVAIVGSLNERQRRTISEKLPVLRQISLQATDLTGYLRLFLNQLGGCPLLDPVDGSCTVYPLRPFSCRALISTRNSSWCAVDFAALHPLEKEAFLSSLDPDVVTFPTHYLAAPQEFGLDLESLAVVAMRERFGVSLSGNLIYLLWLELAHRLSEVVTGGFAKTRDFLEERQLDLPFLLQLQGE